VLRDRPEAEVAALVERVVRAELRWRGPRPAWYRRERLHRQPVPVLHAPEERPPEAPAPWSAAPPDLARWVAYPLPGVGSLRLPPWLRPTEPQEWSTTGSAGWLARKGAVPTMPASVAAAAPAMSAPRADAARRGSRGARPRIGALLGAVAGGALGYA
jgi:hypothetical protein